MYYCKNKYSNNSRLLLTFLLVILPLFSASAFAEVISANVSPDIQEPAGIYDQGGINILNMTIDTVIQSGACVTGDYQGCTLNDVLNDLDGADDFKPEIQVHMTADDFPDDGKISNASLRLRGLITRSDAQKSFRVKLNSKKNLWRGERKIQLVKAMRDQTRVRNKLSFDLFAQIPHFPSMRTQFIKLTLNDQDRINQGLSSNFGLFTHIENFGKEYLKRRGWDKDSRVYKISNWKFHNDPELALDANGVPIDLNAFEKKIEIKRGKTHFDLLNMTRDLNDPSKDFNTEIMGKYFNQDNYLTWFAVNILVNNTDTTRHNFYLYNPKNTEHFYLVPWDYDHAFGAFIDIDNLDQTISHLPRWWYTHANWWKVYLHRRFLSVPGNLQKLKEAVQQIKEQYLTKEIIDAKVDAYRDIVFPILNQQPDRDHLYVGNTDPERIAEFNRLYDNFSKYVQLNYDLFNARINDPMPFYLNEAVDKGNHNYQFKWQKSQSLTGQTIEYELEISTDKLFSNGTIIEKISHLSNTQYTLNWSHPAGTYYYRVRARDAANPQKYWQDAQNDEGLDYNGLEIYGVRKLIVNDGGVTPLKANKDEVNATDGVALSIDVLANDTGTNLTIGWYDEPLNGVMQKQNNKFIYTANQGFSGMEDLWYEIVDASGATTWGQLIINVSAGGGGSSILKANKDEITVSSGSATTIDVLANDTGSNLQIIWYDAPLNGSINQVNNQLVYTANQGFSGTEDVWYKISDASGQTTWGQLLIYVTGSSTPVVKANNDTASVKLGDTILIDVLANDTGSGIVLSEIDEVWTGSIATTNGQIKYTANGTHTGTVNTWYKITDRNGNNGSWAKISITITP